MDELPLIYDSPVADALDHVRALKKFLRSISLLAIIGFLVRGAMELRSAHVTLLPDFVTWGLLVGACAALALGGYITFYQHASGMMRAYLLCGSPEKPTTLSITDLRNVLINRARQGPSPLPT